MALPFTAARDYTLGVAVTDLGGQTATINNTIPTVTKPVNQVVTSVVITPDAAAVLAGGSART
jgi:hypothetical protein